MSFFPNPIVTQGGQNKSIGTDPTVEELLQLILYELQLIRMHQEFTTDENPTINDIEDNYG